MSLFPEENILTKEIESWRVFADSLKSEEDKKLFLDMLEKCHKYSVAINAKGRPFSTEPLIMALLLADRFNDMVKPVILTTYSTNTVFSQADRHVLKISIHS